MKREVTPEEAANIADRYTRGQSIKFISFAVSRDVRVVKRVLEGAGIRIERHAKRNPNWGWTG